MKRNRQDQNRFSRRDFIKATAAGAGAAALAGLGAEGSASEAGCRNGDAQPYYF